MPPLIGISPYKGIVLVLGNNLAMTLFIPPANESLVFRYWKKIASSVLLIMLILFVWVAANSIDKSSFDDKGLLDIFDEDFSDQKNAWPQISNLVKTNSDYADNSDFNRLKRHVFGQEWDEGFVVDLLEREKALIEFGSQLNESYYIKHAEGYDAILSVDFLPPIIFTRLLLLKSMALARQGELSEALDFLLHAKNSALLMKENKNYTLIGYRIGEVCLRSSLFWAHQLVSNYPLEDSHYSTIKNIIDSIPSYHADGFENVFSGEYYFMQTSFEAELSKSIAERYKELKNLTETLGSDSEEFGVSSGIQGYLRVIWPRYYSHPNRFLHATAPHFIAFKEQSRYPCNNQVFSAYDEEFTTQKIYQSGLLISPELYSFLRYFDDRCTVANYIESMKAIVSLYWYKHENGEFPPDFAALIPNYSSRLPADYFSGKELHYSNADHWFYSGGKVNSNSKGSKEAMYVGICTDENVCWENPTISIHYDAELAW